MAGGKPVIVSLERASTLDGEQPSSRDWKLDFNKLEAAITPKSKMMMLNNPHNPIGTWKLTSGKVFSRKELELIAAFSEKHDLLLIADEVYETLV